MADTKPGSFRRLAAAALGVFRWSGRREADEPDPIPQPEVPESPGAATTPIRQAPTLAQRVRALRTIERLKGHLRRSYSDPAKLARQRKRRRERIRKLQLWLARVEG